MHPRAWLANVAVAPSVTVSFAPGGATAGTVRVERELVRENGLGAEEGECHDARIVELDAVSGELRETMLRAEGVSAPEDAFPVAGKALPMRI